MEAIGIRFGRARGRYVKPETDLLQQRVVVRHGKAQVRPVVSRGYLERMEQRARKKDVAGVEVLSLKTGTLPTEVKAHYEDPAVQGLLFFRARQNARAMDLEIADEIEAYS